MVDAERPSVRPQPARAVLGAVAPRSSASAAPKPAASAAAAKPRLMSSEKTVREILPPWHVMQEKMQSKVSAAPKPLLVPADQAARELLLAQETANAQWMPRQQPVESPLEVPPSSGVRVSDPGVDVTDASDLITVDEPLEAAPPVPDSMLSFKVYTLAELERRADGPSSARMTRAAFDQLAARPPVQWRRLYAALSVFGAASLAWLKIKGARPSPRVTLRQPFDALGDELQRAVDAVDWKKLGVRTGIVVGATLTLLFAVLTAAELTDDLKPGSRIASKETSLVGTTALAARGVAAPTNAAANGAQPAVLSATAPGGSPALVADATQPSSSVDELDELDGVSHAATASARRTPSTKKLVKVKTSSKLTFRNADAIFHP